MATVIHNDTSRPDRPVIVERDSGLGWAVAVIVLVAVIIGGAYVWARAHRSAPAQAPNSTINVTVPSADQDMGTPTPNNTAPGGSAPGNAAQQTQPMVGQ